MDHDNFALIRQRMRPISLDPFEVQSTQQPIIAIN